MDAGVLFGLSLSPPLSLCLCLLSLLWRASLLSLLLPSVRCRLCASYKSYHYPSSFRLCTSCMRHIYRLSSCSFKCAGTLAFVRLQAAAYTHSRVCCRSVRVRATYVCYLLRARRAMAPYPASCSCSSRSRPA